MSAPPPLRPQRPSPTPLADVVRWAGGRLEPARTPDENPGAAGASESSVSVTGITLSTDRVQPGDLFAALPGSRTHGIAHAAKAVAAGAVAVLTDPAGADDPARPAAVPVIVTADPRAVLGRVAARIYGEPAAAMAMIGVTGTQGKTTTTRLAEGGLSGAGITAAVVGTVGTRITGHEVKTALTTPEAPDLHGLFAVMREQGVGACAMEVSSHALVLGRVDGVRFDVAVFLNLGRDHLDFHPTLEDYYRAKASLFAPERARLALVNLDDEHGRRLADEAAEGGVAVRTFAVADPDTARVRDADWRAVDLDVGPAGSRFTIVAPDGTHYPAAVALPGAFNVSNALAAVAAAAEAGFDAGAVAAGLAASGGVPGRLERVDTGLAATVVVDYAHKPDAVAAAIGALRPLADAQGGRVLVVLGAGGDRDPGKRPLMGRTAAALADLLVVTDDNPRTEDPAAIRAAVLAETDGARAVVHEIGDRRRAIGYALEQSRAGDLVLVAGKGHETGQEIDGVVHPFDDRDVVRELAATIAGTSGANR